MLNHKILLYAHVCTCTCVCKFLIIIIIVLIHVDVLRGYAQEVESHSGRNPKDLTSPSSFAGHSGAGNEPMS